MPSPSTTEEAKESGMKSTQKMPMKEGDNDENGTAEESEKEQSSVAEITAPPPITIMLSSEDAVAAAAAVDRLLTTEESRKEHAAAEIMAALKPPSSSSVSVGDHSHQTQTAESVADAVAKRIKAAERAAVSANMATLRPPATGTATGTADIMQVAGPKVAAANTMQVADSALALAAVPTLPSIAIAANTAAAAVVAPIAANTDTDTNTAAVAVVASTDTAVVAPAKDKPKHKAKPPQKQKKRKYPHNRVNKSVTPSIPLPFRLMDDSEFVRTMAAEFKRRGYTVAMQLGSDLESKFNEKQQQEETSKMEEEEGEGEGEESESKPPAEKKSKVSAEVAAAAAAAPSTYSDDEDNGNNNKHSSSLPDFAFHPSTVTISAKNTKTWNNMFEKLQQFHDQNCGVFPLHPSNDTSNALVKWTKSQLTLWKRMKRDSKHNLSLERIQKLTSVDFDTIVQWQNDPKRFMNNSAEDGGEDGENNTAATEQRMAMMEPSGRNAQKWQSKFDDLKIYKGLHGHCNVPRSYDDSLSKWCATQRVRCKEVLNDDDAKTPMTPSQFQALEGIEFDMTRSRKIYDRRVIEKRWDDRYAELLAYKAKFGNTDVAVRKGFEDYKQLANWAGLQRRKYKAKQTGTKAGRTTGITDEEIKKLASVGFSFSLQDDFDTRFKHLLEFKKEFGHTKVPVFYTGYNNLGRWAKRMRDGIRNEEPWMDEVRSTRLLGIDFDIAARHVFGHKPKKKPEDGMEDIEEMGEIEVEDVVGPVEVVVPVVEAQTMPVVEAQAVAAATTMARMDGTDYGRPSIPPFFYHGYPPAQP